MEEYALDSAEAAYDNPGEQAPMGIMALGGEIQGSENESPQMDRKRLFYPSLTGNDNTRWDAEYICMSMGEEAIRNAIVRFNTRVEFWGCINSPRYHADRFHNYRNCPNKRDPDVTKQENNSIQQYVQHTSMKVGSRDDQYSQDQHGYTSSMEVRCQFTPSLWRHTWLPITFTLVVDDFGVKLEGECHANNIKKCLEKHYEVSIDWSGSLFFGIHLDWNYKKGYVNTSMPGYVEKARHKYLVKLTCRLC